MKKNYIKPLICIETMSMDQPIAVNCTANRDDMELLEMYGFFAPDSACTMWLGTGEEGDGGKIDWDRNNVWDDTHNTVCYHSNVTVAFLS